MADSTQANNNKLTFKWQKDNLSQATQGTWHHQDPDSISFDSFCISTDTRKISQGDVFLAIKGDNFNGHYYLQQAKELGAIAAIVSDVQDIDLPQLQVVDTKLALGDLGKFVRDSKTNLNVVALTGSMGKTTTKEMLGSILSQKAPTLITRGNLNNDLGVPMMLLELSDKHEYAVMELGANHVGEIAYTTGLVNPDVACVLNIGTAHLGEFGGRDNICKAKAEIYQGLNADDSAVYPATDDYTEKLKEQASEYSQHTVSFGRTATADVNASDVDVGALGSRFNLVFTEHAEQSYPVALNFAGEHNVTNALAAAACAYRLGFSPEAIAQGLTKAIAPKGRLNPITHGKHLLIDDTYNSNPDATLAAAGVLEKATLEHQQHDQATQSILVIGDIGELGDDGELEHSKLGEKLAQKNIDHLLCVGELMAHCAAKAKNAGLAAQHFTDKTALASHLTSLMSTQASVVLFKGSRFMAMESIIADVQ